MTENLNLEASSVYLAGSTLSTTKYGVTTL